MDDVGVDVVLLVQRRPATAQLCGSGTKAPAVGAPL